MGIEIKTIWLDGEVQEVVADFGPFELTTVVAPVPGGISDRQFFQGLAEWGVIPWDQAFAAIKTGDIPSELQTYLAEIADPLERTRAEFKVSGAVEFRFDDPLVPLIQSKKGWDDAKLAEFWQFCSTL